MNSLCNLKVGDKVLVSYRVRIGWITYTNYKEAVVQKITPSGLIVVDERKFYPKTGRERTSDRYPSSIACIDDINANETMEDVNKKIKINDVLNKMNMLDRHKLTYDQAIKICKIMGWEDLFLEENE